eukprot:8824803-Karenia_brevis.AAC.1
MASTTTSSPMGLMLAYMEWHDVARFAAAKKQREEFHEKADQYKEASKHKAKLALEEQLGVEEVEKIMMSMIND